MLKILWGFVLADARVFIEGLGARFRAEIMSQERIVIVRSDTAGEDDQRSVAQS